MIGRGVIALIATMETSRLLTGLICLAAVVLAGLAPLRASEPPTAEEYIKQVGGGAELIPAGQMKLDNQFVFCGRRPTVLNSQLDDYGAAFPGYMILNPRLLARVSTPVKQWIYAHECGHQFR